MNATVQEDRWTPAILLKDYDTEPTTWHCSHHVPAGTKVVVQWRPDVERIRVYERFPWGLRPLFSCQLEAARKYVRSVQRSLK
jgi:hypothetical protein